MKENDQKEEEYSIRLPNIVLWAALIDLAGFLVLALYALSRNSMAAALIFAALAILATAGALVLYANWRIRFNSESFSFRSILGKTSCYHYDDIEKIVAVKNHFRVILPERELCLPGNTNASRYFRDYAGMRGEETASKDDFTVMRQSNFLLIIGAGAILFSTSVIFAVDDFKTRMVMACFLFLGVLLYLARTNSSIRYNEEEIISRNFLGFEKRHRVSDMTYLTEISRDYMIYFGKDRILVDSLLTGQMPFFDFVFKKLEENGRDCMARNKDLFNGHLLFPGQHILIAAIFIIMLGGAALYVQFVADSREAGDENRTVTFTKAAYDDSLIDRLDALSRLELRDEEGESYVILGFKEYGIAQNAFFENVRSRTTFHVDGTYEPKNADFFIKACADDAGTVYLSLNDSIRAESYADDYDTRALAGAAGIISVLFFLYVILVRHLDRCPKGMVFVALLLGKPSSNFIKKRPDLFNDDEESTEKNNETVSNQNSENPET